MTSLHVSIIGAGLGGLCLAQGLRQAGVSFDVYERDDSAVARFQGYRLRINADGRDAIAECVPPARAALLAASAAMTRHTGRFVTPQLTDFAVRIPPSWQQPGDAASDAPPPRGSAPAKSADPANAERPDLSVHRQTLRELLLDGIEEHVHFGHAFSHTTRTGDGLRIAHFGNGQAGRAGLVVAADGTHSRVREHLLPGMGAQETGTVCVYGLTPLTTSLLVQMDAQGEAALMQGTTVVFADGFAVVVDAMLFRRGSTAQTSPALSPVPDYLYWAFIGPTERLTGDARTSLTGLADSPLEHLSALTQHWHPHLRLLMTHAAPDSVRAIPVRTTTSPLPWQLDGVTGLGDAVHTMSPAGGLGANTALQDAALLARHLAEVTHGSASLAQAVRRYEGEMCERAQSAIGLSQAGAALLNRQRPAHPVVKEDMRL